MAKYKLKVGDVVKGGKNNTYSITSGSAIMEVEAFHGDGYMDVKILEHKNDKKHVGKRFSVRVDCFILKRGYEKKKVKKVAKNSYGVRLKELTDNFPTRFYPRGEWKQGIKKLKPYITGDWGTADFIILRADGTYKTHLHAPCHAPLGYEAQKLPMYVVSSVRKGMDNGEELIDWMINRSVYADKIVNSTVEDVFERGLIIRTNMPSNLMAEALILTRQLWEYPHIINAWKKMVDGGIGEDIAMPLAHFLSGEKDEWEYVEASCGHNAMNANFMDIEFFKNYLSRTPKNPNEDFIKNSSYRGIHSLWSFSSNDMYEGRLKGVVCRAGDFKADNVVVETCWGDKVIHNYMTEKSMVSQMKALSDKILKEIGNA